MTKFIRGKARLMRQKLRGSRRVEMLRDYLNHEKLSVIASRYNIDMSAPSGMLHRYGIIPNPVMGRPKDERQRTTRDWIIIFIRN